MSYKFENFNYLNVAFFKLQAYHVGLNANSGGCRTPDNDEEKCTFGFDQVRVLVCTTAVSFGDS